VSVRRPVRSSGEAHRPAPAWSRRIGLLILASIVAASCGGSPSGPGPIVTPPPEPQPPPPNSLPVVESLRAQGRRLREPPQFADVDEVIDLTASVRDEETATADLQFEWTSNAGTIEGTGPAVAWRAPNIGLTPVQVTVTLKVVEKYGYPGGPKIYQHDVSASVPISLHDSVREVGDMARQFLLDFSDSSIRDVPFIMRNFQQGCYGTAEETAQVTENRRRYQIIDSRVGAAATTIGFGGVCPYAGKRGDACTSVPVSWTSIDHDDKDKVGTAAGTDWLASFYIADERRWRLCDSSFQPNGTTTLREFMR
jgi:hypothetical protein